MCFSTAPCYLLLVLKSRILKKVLTKPYTKPPCSPSDFTRFGVAVRVNDFRSDRLTYNFVKIGLFDW